ncbi:MAG: hypothetical protein PHU25_19055 [Deltaproteobacteria bacterium]|nr:hypothetical protein [Deltaproteobacteria bacterium]
MRRASFILGAAACVLALGCTDEAKNKAASPAPATRLAAKAPAPFPAPAKPGPAILGRVSLGGAAEQGDLSFSIDRDDRVSGALVLGASRIEISGVKDGDTLRGWLARSCDATTEISRGTLYGSKSAKGWSGAITLAGNGGDTLRTGTWTAGP